MTLRESGDYGEAERVVKQAMEKNPGNQTLVFELAMVYFQSDRGDAAIVEVEKVLDKDPDNPQALNFIGYTWAEQGIKLDEAEAMIRRALAQKPGAGFIMDSLGWVYYQRGDYDEALKWLTKAVESGEDDPEVLEHLGDCYLAVGQGAKAKETYKKALEKSYSERVKKKIEKKLEKMK